MNIFIMILVAVFMAGYYMLSSPSQQIANQSTQYAVNVSDLRSVAQCAVAMHNAQINGTEFHDICLEQNQITSEFVCMDKRLKQINCNVVKNNKPEFNYIVTVTAPIPKEQYNQMMEILEKHYSESSSMGLIIDNTIIAGGTSMKREIPKAIVNTMKLTDGQLIYLTQYEPAEAPSEYEIATTPEVICPVGTAKIYKFGRWQCIEYNTKTNCGGDMIWDSDLYECVPDQSRKPLCADNQTAIMVDDVWECINPFPEKSCPNKMVARLNYNTMEWECVVDPTIDSATKKCAHVAGGAVYGGQLGATLRVPHTSCTDCEIMVTDMETCVATCIPDPGKINNKNCYPGDIKECSGSTRAIYFGFPNVKYAEKIDSLKDVAIPMDADHSQNRKFNCLDCGLGEIDSSKSHPPYIAVCK